MARALRALAINRWKKNLVRNLQYGPKTRLISGIYLIEVLLKPRYKKSLDLQIPSLVGQFEKINAYSSLHIML